MLVEFQNIRAQGFTLNVDPSVSFAIRLKSLYNLMSIIDIFILVLIYDGFSFSPFER